MAEVEERTSGGKETEGRRVNAYLTIMVTVLVATQVIRITQNAINLHRQNGEIKKACGWIRDNDVSELDFQIQRDTFY